MLVAQFLVLDKGLKECKLCISSTGANRERQIETMQSLLYTDCWSEILVLKNLDNFFPTLKNPISFFYVKQEILNLKKSTKIENNTNLYFGDINHPSYLFLTRYFYRSKAYFFEEGMSHYAPAFFKKRFEKNNATVLRKLLFDILSSLFFKISNFSIVAFATDDLNPLNHFKIEKRYNLLERNNSSKEDEFLDSLKFKNYIKEYRSKIDFFNILNKNKQEIVIYLSSTVKSYFDDPFIDIFIIDKIVKENERALLYVKFHPKEEKNKVDEITSKIKLKYPQVKILSDFNEIPFELIGIKIEIKKIYSFGSSASFYLEKIDNTIEVEHIFNLLGDLYLKNNQNSQFLLYIKGIHNDVFKNLNSKIYIR